MSSLGALAEIRRHPGASTRPSRWPLADIQVAGRSRRVGLEEGNAPEERVLELCSVGPRELRRVGAQQD
jgi:hypothetical protein